MSSSSDPSTNPTLPATGLSSGLTQTLQEALQEVLDEGSVLTSAPDLFAYARDCWPRNTLRVRDGDTSQARPICIVQPSSEDQVAEIIQIAEKHDIAVIPYGAGSGVCGGTVPVKPSITVDLKRLRRMEIDPERLQVHIGSGVIGQHAETALLRQGFTLGHYPSSLYCSSVGGYVATRSAGQYSSRYGKIEDMVTSMRVVVSEGEVLDTGEISAEGGPDLLPLMVGSEGTLGIITESTLRIWPAPAHRRYRGWMMPNISTGSAGMRALLQAGLRPAVIRLYDAPDTLIGHRDAGRPTQPPPNPSKTSNAPPKLFAKLLARAKKAFGETMDPDTIQALAERIKKQLMARVLAHPLLTNRALGVIPGTCLLIVGFEGSEEEVEAESKIAYDLLAPQGKDLGPDPGDRWYDHRFAVSYKLSPTLDTGGFVDTMEVATSWSNLLNLYENVRRAVSPFALVLAHFSHAYHEGCSIYFTFAGFADTPEKLLERYDQAWSAGMNAVMESGSAATHHHGVGLFKAPYVPRDQIGGRPLFERLKRSFDPQGIFNPGKVWSPIKEEQP